MICEKQNKQAKQKHNKNKNSKIPPQIASNTQFSMTRTENQSSWRRHYGTVQVTMLHSSARMRIVLRGTECRRGKQYPHKSKCYLEFKNEDYTLKPFWVK